MTHPTEEISSVLECDAAPQSARSYLVVYEKGASNWSGYSPQVPGCISVGRDLAEMRSMMTEALESHLALLLEDGDPIPDSNSITTINFAEETMANGVEHCHVEWLPVRISREFLGTPISQEEADAQVEENDAEIHVGAARSIFSAAGIEYLPQPNEKTNA